MEIKEKILELEKVIGQKVEDFEHDTGLVVNYISRPGPDGKIRILVQV